MSEPTTPDHWTAIADDLVQIADRLRTLAGTDTPPTFGPYLSLYSDYVADDADRSVPVVDAIAAAFGAEAVTKTEGRGSGRQTERKVKATCGRVRIAAAAHMPNPPTRSERLRSRAELETEAAELRAEIAALRAQQAGGAR